MKLGQSREKQLSSDFASHYYITFEIEFFGYIDFGDKCWRRNVLATKCIWRRNVHPLKNFGKIYMLDFCEILK